MPNLLPLEAWRALLGLHPVHFFGLSGPLAPISSACNTVTREHAWQDAQAVGRQEIREAIETAESRLREWLGYSVAPEYVSETRPYSGVITLDRGYIQAVGTETLTRLDGASVVFEDTDGDGLRDTFDITYQTEVDASELALYFLPEDRLDDDPISDRWRVQPLRVVTDGDLIHIRGKAWQLVRPSLLERVSAEQIDPAESSNFVAGLEIYQRTTATPQATLTWNAAPYPPYCCPSTTTDPAAIATASARVAILDAEHGIVQAVQAAYDDDASAWYAVPYAGCRWPDSVTIQYLAGIPLENGQMARSWQTIVARLAAAELASPICACNVANRTLAYWQTDVARTGGNNDDQFGAISQQQLDNPFGTRRGHLYAWQQVRHLQQLRGLLPG